MFKKKNFRRRQDDDDGDGGGEGDARNGGTAAAKPAALKTTSNKPKATPATTKATPSSLLSFAADEEGEGDDGGPFGMAVAIGGRSKPSSKESKAKSRSAGFGTGHGEGHRVNRDKKGREERKGREEKREGGKGGGGVVVGGPSAGGALNVMPQSGEYTKEKLAELARNTMRIAAPSSASRRTPHPPSASIAAAGAALSASAAPSSTVTPPSLSEPLIVLRGSLKPAGSAAAEAEAGASGSGAAGSAGAAAGMGGLGGGLGTSLRKAGGSYIGGTFIPDAAAIAAAKAKRERLRQAKAAPDFIPLPGSDRSDMAGLGSMRGVEDEMGEEEGEKGKGEQSSEDEEEALGGRVALGGVAGAWGYGGAGGMGGAGSIVAEGDEVMKFLREGLARLQASQSKAEQEAREAEDRLVAAADEVLELERAMKGAEGKYRFVQDLRQYVAVLCDFLKDKAALIEELEESLQQLQEERANAAFDRRRADLADELAQAEAATSAAAAAMAQGAGTVTAAAAAAAAAEAVVEGGGAAGGRVELDEFGRDVNLQKRVGDGGGGGGGGGGSSGRGGGGRGRGGGRAGGEDEFGRDRRVAARERRHAKAEARRAGRGEAEGGGGGGGGGVGRVEGEWSSDESDDERSAYSSGRQEILTAADAVFADAAEEYSRIERVKERMERWKQQHLSTYRDAYASMSAPALFAPFVRLELLRWDPLFGGGAFDSMHWYSVLFDYGLPTDGSEPAPDDPDTNLVPRLVEKVGLPILHHALQHCWDPLDRAATNRAATAVEEVLVYVEAGAPAVVEMMKAVEGRIESAAGEMQLPAWPPPVLASCPAAARFAAQRFGQALRLIHNLGRMREVVSQSLLDRLVLQSLLANQLLPHLCALAPTLHDAVPRTERLVCVLCDGKWAGTGSGSALPPSAEPRNSPRSPLSQLVAYIETLGRSVESRSAVEGQREECVGLARRLKRMLVQMEEMDKARALGKSLGTFLLRSYALPARERSASPQAPPRPCPQALPVSSLCTACALPARTPPALTRTLQAPCPSALMCVAAAVTYVGATAGCAAAAAAHCCCRLRCSCCTAAAAAAAALLLLLLLHCCCC
ncbi:unnamed protein product [Closterium sp. NIES-53]